MYSNAHAGICVACARGRDRDTTTCWWTSARRTRPCRVFDEKFWMLKVHTHAGAKQADTKCLSNLKIMQHARMHVQLQWMVPETWVYAFWFRSVVRFVFDVKGVPLHAFTPQFVVYTCENGNGCCVQRMQIKKLSWSERRKFVCTNKIAPGHYIMHALSYQIYNYRGCAAAL